MSSDLFDLTGEVAVVTGAGRGIGEGIAKVLADYGATVICAARRTNAFEVPVMRDAIIAESLSDNRLADQLVALGTINNRIFKTIKIVCIIQSKSNQSNHKMELYIQQYNK